MSDALDKAEAAAREAAVNTAAVQIALAAVELAKTAQAQQQAPAPHTCQQHDHGRRPGRSAGEWMAIGCAACIGSVGIAFASIALAIGGMTVAILALVLRSIWRDIQKRR